MHSTEFAFQFSFPLREKVSSTPLVNLVWHKGNDKSNRCNKPLLLMHSVIESEYSVYTDDVPDALTAEIMIRKIQIMLTSIILSHSIIQFSFLQPVLSFLLNYSVLSYMVQYFFITEFKKLLRELNIFGKTDASSISQLSTDNFFPQLL